MRRVSVSELTKYEACRREWKYSYVDRLSLVTEKRGGPLASGTSVHYVVEHVLSDHGGKVPDSTRVRALATECLRDEFRNSEYTEAQVKKYLPGVVRAVSKIPEDIWTRDWHVEWDLSTELSIEPVLSSGEDAIELVGRPDLYCIDGDTIELVDVKTTKTDPLVYMLWEPQITYYALMLQGMFPNKIIKYRYLCVPTQGDKPAPQAPTWVFKSTQLERARAEIVRLVREMDPEHTEMRRGRKCDWCTYAALCTAEITGADVEGVKAELYTVRKTSTERTEEIYDV